MTVRLSRPLAVLMLIGVAASLAPGQGIDPVGRPVVDVRVTGLENVKPQLVFNQIRTEPGDPYRPEQIATDIRNITRLGRFDNVRADVQQGPEGGIILTYVVQEQPLLADVQVVGNKRKSDQELLSRTLLRAGDPMDEFLIQRGREQIRRAYRDAGHYLADVTVDQETLEESDVLIYRVREGPRVKIRGLRFRGNEAFTASQLNSEIESETYFPIFRKGELSQEKLDLDAGRLREFYRSRGYLNAQVSRRIELSPDQDDATVVFVIEEGRRYTIRSIRFEIDGKGVYAPDTLRDAMALKKGSVYSSGALSNSRTGLLDLYGKRGYLARAEGGKTSVNIERVFAEEEPAVDLIVRINEGQAYKVGNVIIRGNPVTQDKVIRHQLRGLQPGRRYDRAGIQRSQRMIEASGLLREPRIDVLGDPDDEVRDALVSVKEARTGSVSLGAAISSDAGVLGAFSLSQKNFDIRDYPESLSELISGGAFRGAGQRFNIDLQPGDELQQYSLSWSDPTFLDTDYTFGLSGRFFTRERDDFDEERLGGFLRFGKRFGDVWSANARLRYENIDIDEIDFTAPVDVFDVEGDSTLTGLALTVGRSTVDSRVFPTEGTRLQTEVERIGALGGDFDFTRLSAEGNAFFTVHEDFFGRATVLSFSGEIGYIFENDEAPIFERFFAGGHSSFRGFDFRGVGPRGVTRAGGVSDESIGGDWLMLVGTEYNFPIWQELLRGVLFVDSGTVDEDLSFDQWRVSVGAGVRLSVPFIGNAPFAFDLAWPVIKEDEDEEQIFSFSLALPF